MKFCNDPANIAAWEMAKHASWWVAGQLDFIIDESDPNVMGA
jgi:hypothetical protein